MFLELPPAIKAVLSESEIKILEQASVHIPEPLKDLMDTIPYPISSTRLKDLVYEGVIEPFESIIDQWRSVVFEEKKFLSIVDDEPPHGYTCGLTRLGKPEIVYMGELVPETIDLLLGVLGNAQFEGKDITSGELRIGTLENGDAVRYQIREVEIGRIRQEISLNLDLVFDIPDLAPIHVLTIADRFNVLPGEDGYDESFVQFNPCKEFW